MNALSVAEHPGSMVFADLTQRNGAAKSGQEFFAPLQLAVEGVLTERRNNRTMQTKLKPVSLLQRSVPRTHHASSQPSTSEPGEHGNERHSPPTKSAESFVKAPEATEHVASN